MTYEQKEQEYYKLFFRMVYDIVYAADDCTNTVTPTHAVKMINELIAVVEDLTCETPIVDYEKEIARFQAQFEEAKKEYTTREYDLSELLIRFHETLCKAGNTKPK